MVAPARLLLCLLGIASALRVPSGAPGRVSRREALGLSAVAEELDLGFAAPRVGSDASAARGMAARHGLGKVKHLELKHLWVQELHKNGEVKTKAIVGVNNPADLWSKVHPGAKLLQLQLLCGIHP